MGERAKLKSKKEKEKKTFREEGKKKVNKIISPLHFFIDKLTLHFQKCTYICIITPEL